MKKCLRVFSLVALGAMTCFSTGFNVDAQEDDPIVIINQDGEKVKPSAIRIQGSGKAEGKGGGTISGRGGISVQNKDGKIIVTDADGNKREIDVEGARSIIVNQSEQVIDNNGERQSKKVGKAIVIGPDGVRHEIDLGGEGLNLPGFAGFAKAERVNNRFMIGVHCEPVGDALRSQLQLEGDAGLVVVQVSKESPAEAAGVENHDILMYAGDRELTKQSDLSEVVQSAGKENQKISMTIIRAGKEIGVDVSPVERPESDFSGIAMPEVFMFDRPGGPGRFNMQFRQLGPGVIFEGDFDQDFDEDFDEDFDSDFHQDIQKQMKEMRSQMERMQKRMQERRGVDKN